MHRIPFLVRVVGLAVLHAGITLGLTLAGAGGAMAVLDGNGSGAVSGILVGVALILMLPLAPVGILLSGHMGGGAAAGSVLFIANSLLWGFALARVWGREPARRGA